MYTLEDMFNDCYSLKLSPSWHIRKFINIKESLWSEIQDRSAGISLSKEDYNLLYGGGDSRQLHKDTYKNMTYEISARKFPYIDIMSKLGISIFSGSSQVILTDDGKVYELQREVRSNCVHFYYNCNKKKDFQGSMFIFL